MQKEKKFKPILNIRQGIVTWISYLFDQFLSWQKVTFLVYSGGAWIFIAARDSSRGTLGCVLFKLEKGSRHWFGY